MKGKPASAFPSEISLDPRSDSCALCLARRLVEGPDGLWYELPHVPGCTGGAHSYGMLIAPPEVDDWQRRSYRAREHAEAFIAGLRAALLQ